MKLRKLGVALGLGSILLAGGVVAGVSTAPNAEAAAGNYGDSIASGCDLSTGTQWFTVSNLHTSGPSPFPDGEYAVFAVLNRFPGGDFQPETNLDPHRVTHTPEQLTFTGIDGRAVGSTAAFIIDGIVFSASSALPGGCVQQGSISVSKTVLGLDSIDLSGFPMTLTCGDDVREFTLGRDETALFDVPLDVNCEVVETNSRGAIPSYPVGQSATLSAGLQFAEINVTNTFVTPEPLATIGEWVDGDLVCSSTDDAATIDQTRINSTTSYSYDIATEAFVGELPVTTTETSNRPATAEEAQECTPTEPVTPVEPIKPVVPVTPVEPIKPAVPVTPVEPTTIAPRVKDAEVTTASSAKTTITAAAVVEAKTNALAATGSSANVLGLFAGGLITAGLGTVLLRRRMASKSARH